MAPLAQQPDEVQFGAHPDPQRRVLAALLVALVLLGALAWHEVSPRLDRHALLTGVPATVRLTSGNGWRFENNDDGSFAFGFPLSPAPGVLHQPQAEAELDGGAVPVQAVLLPPDALTSGDFRADPAPAVPLAGRGDRLVVRISGAVVCGSHQVRDALAAGRLEVRISFVRLGRRESVRVLEVPRPDPEMIGVVC